MIEGISSLFGQFLQLVVIVILDTKQVVGSWHWGRISDLFRELVNHSRKEFDL